jgi:hypothetical protein
MNIGFDLDGVVIHQDQAIFNLIHQLPNEKKLAAYRYYCSQRPTNFNPADYLGPEDQGFFITARGDDVADLTVAWQKRYFPGIKLILTNCYNVTAQWTGSNFAISAKYNAIVENKIDVFFEDSPEIVKALREKCEHCKIIHYGGRII